MSLFLTQVSEADKKRKNKCNQCKWQKFPASLTQYDGCGHPKKSAFNYTCRLFEQKR